MKPAISLLLTALILNSILISGQTTGNSLKKWLAEKPDFPFNIAVLKC